MFGSDLSDNEAGLRAEIARLQAEKNALLAIAGRRDFLADILESMTDWVTVTDLDGKVLYTTPSVRRILGCEPGELINRESIHVLWEGTDGASAPAEVMRTTLEQGAWRGEVRTRVGGDRIVVLSIQTTALRDDEGKRSGIICVARDITEQKRTEEALLLSEQRFREMADLMPDALGELDERMRVTYVNRNTIEIFGYSRDELTTLPSVLDLIHPEDRERAAENIRRLLTGERQANEYRLIRKDGAVLNVLTNSSPIYRNDRITGVRLSLTDITYLKRAEKEREVTEARYRMLVEAMNDGLGVQDADGHLIYVNNRLCTMLGYTPEEVMGKRTTDFLDEESRQIFFREVARRKERTRNPYEVVFRKKDGTPVTVVLSPAPLYDTEGNFQGSFGVLTDISGRKEAEASVRASEERFRTILENSRDIAFKLDAVADRYEYISPSVYNLLGFTPEETMQISRSGFDARVHPDDLERVTEHRKKQVRRPKNENAPPLIEYRLEHKDGTYRWFCESTRLIRNEQGGLRTVVGTLRDITEQKQAEQALLMTSRMEATATLAGGIAHDFNNLMVGVLGNAELIQLKLGTQPQTDRLLANIMEAAQRAGELAQKMLAFARGGKYQPQVINLNEYILETLQLEERSFPPRITIETNLNKDIWLVRADPAQMNQVIMNLSINAVEAIEDYGRISIETGNVYVDHHLARTHPGLAEGRHVCISVQDTGKGMSPDVKARVFEPFFTTKFQGRGLGMAAVYGIIKNHDGFISIYSEEGRGTSFKVYLPAVVRQEGEAGSESKPRNEHAKQMTDIPSGNGEIVLLIEDEEIVAKVTREILEGLGYKVIVARNGQEAIDIARNSPAKIHVAILDMGMPVMGGSQAFGPLIEAQPEMRVIICSGYELGPAARELLDAGARGFVQKPFRAEALATEIRKALE